MSATHGKVMERLRQKFNCGIHAAVLYLRKKRFSGHCTICGKDTIFYMMEKNLRETFMCKACGASSRNRHVAKVLQDVYKVSPPYSLHTLVENHPDLRVYEAGSSGPIHAVLRNLKGYACSEFFYDVPLGQCSRRGVRCENVESLTFADDSFDIVITQDVFEHVRESDRGFKEIHRVLKKGGVHVFTVPMNPFEKTRKRVEIREGKEVYVLPKTYHFDPTRGGLVYTDFGYDLPHILGELGFSTEIVWCNGVDGQYYGIYWICTILGFKK